MQAEITLINASFSHIKNLERIYGDAIPAAIIEQGFIFQGTKVLLLNRAGGIFKPKQMSKGLISIKTTIPRDGGINIYNDQLHDDGYYEYSLQLGDPKGGRNVYLWQALESRQPFIYFHAIAPAVYKAIWPCFIDSIHPELGFAKILVGVPEYSNKNESTLTYKVAEGIESRYLVKETKVRLHQASFRRNILSVYEYRCAITGISEQKLIEASHIIPDSTARIKQKISNGIALSNIHHKAYDRDLMGINADGIIHINPKLAGQIPNTFLKTAFLKYDKKPIALPKNKAHQPDKESLARRFETFQESW